MEADGVPPRSSTRESTNHVRAPNCIAKLFYNEGSSLPAVQIYLFLSHALLKTVVGTADRKFGSARVESVFHKQLNCRRFHFA